jgi:hypothetical protein
MLHIVESNFYKKIDNLLAERIGRWRRAGYARPPYDIEGLGEDDHENHR